MTSEAFSVQIIFLNSSVGSAHLAAVLLTEVCACLNAHDT